VCPHCEQKVPKTKYCISCGGEIGSTDIDKKSQEIAQVNCANCQKRVPDLPYCIHCGQALTKSQNVDTESRLCPLCRKEIPISTHVFCHLCGAQLKTPLPTSVSQTIICNHCWKPNPPNTGNCIHCAKTLARKPRKTVLLEEPFNGYQLELSQLLKPTTVPLSIIKQKVSPSFPVKSTILHSPYFGVVIKSRQRLSFLDKNFGGFNRENILNYIGSFIIVIMLYSFWNSTSYQPLLTTGEVDPTINGIYVVLGGFILYSLLMMPIWLSTFFVYRKNGYHINYRLDTSRVLITMIFNLLWGSFGGGGPILLRLGDIRKTEERAIKNSSFIKGISWGSMITIGGTLLLTVVNLLTFGILTVFSGIILKGHLLKSHVVTTFIGATWVSLMLILPLGDFYDRIIKEYNMVIYFVMLVLAILMLLYSYDVIRIISPA
jgi:hypothetical protein